MMTCKQYRVSRKSTSNTGERSPVRHVFIRFDGIEGAISLARAVSLECRGGSLCVVSGIEMRSGGYTCRLVTTPKRMRKTGKQVKEDIGLKDPVFLLF